MSQEHVQHYLEALASLLEQRGINRTEACSIAIDLAVLPLSVEPPSRASLLVFARIERTLDLRKRGVPVDEIAEKVGRSRAWVYDTLRAA